MKKKSAKKIYKEAAFFEKNGIGDYRNEML